MPTTLLSRPPKDLHAQYGQRFEMPKSRPTASDTSMPMARVRRATIALKRLPFGPCSALMLISWLSVPLNQCTATAWVRQVPWKRQLRHLLSVTASCHPPPASPSQTQSATWTSFRIRPARQRRNTLFRTPLPSEDSTPSCFSEDLTASSAVLNQKVECTGASLDGLLSSFAGADANYIVHSRPYRQRRRREDLCLTNSGR